MSERVEIKTINLDERLTYEFIKSYIPSKDTAAYLHAINHQFSELEKATIIGNHECLSKDEKLEALQRMKELTKDESLQERIEWAMELIQKNKYAFDSSPAWDAFHDFFPIPHNFRHGDIVRLVGNGYRSVLGVILGYDEKNYRFYCNLSGDYSDIQVTVDTRFLIKGCDDNGAPIYDYLGEFSHEHINPIYIERIQLEPDNECRLYLEYLAACDTPQEKEKRKSAEQVIIKQLQNVWQYYPKLNLTELVIMAAKVAKLWLNSSQTSIKKLIALPKAKDIDIEKIKDFELMDGLFHMLPERAKKDIWSKEADCRAGEECGMM
ncbi:MAG: hypothetical protein NC433_08915 [Clostridiales bacterium]|nr:hypothetical protein [Clostridiales bacterium]